MTKDKYFTKLHQKLADKFNVTPDVIHRVRAHHFQQDLSLRELRQFYQKRLYKKGKRKSILYNKLIDLLDRVESDSKSWKEIVKKTKYDTLKIE